MTGDPKSSEFTPVRRVKSTMVMENPNVAPASPSPPPRQTKTVRLTQDDLREPTTAPLDEVAAVDPLEPNVVPAVLSALEPLTDEDFTFSGTDNDWADHGGLEPMPTERELQAAGDVSRPTDPPPMPGAVDVYGPSIAPADAVGQMVTLVNGANEKERFPGVVQEMNNKHLFVAVGGETKRMSRATGFEHPPGGSWSVWRLSGADHQRWKRRRHR